MSDITRRIREALERLAYLKDAYVADRVAYEEWGSAELEATVRAALARIEELEGVASRHHDCETQGHEWGFIVPRLHRDDPAEQACFHCGVRRKPVED